MVDPRTLLERIDAVVYQHEQLQQWDVPDTAGSIYPQQAAAVELARHLNGPMVNRLRACAADTTPNWEGATTVYPPETRGLVALIDALVLGQADTDKKEA